MRAEGVEPPRLASPEPKSGASTSSATPATRDPSGPSREKTSPPALGPLIARRSRESGGKSTRAASARPGALYRGRAASQSRNGAPMLEVGTSVFVFSRPGRRHAVSSAPAAPSSAGAAALARLAARASRRRRLRPTDAGGAHGAAAPAAGAGAPTEIWGFDGWTPGPLLRYRRARSSRSASSTGSRSR